MNIISYGLKAGFARITLELRREKCFVPQVRGAAARVMFDSTNVGGLSWSALFGQKNNLKLAIAQSLAKHNALPLSGPIVIDKFKTREEVIPVSERTSNYDPATAIMHTMETYGSITTVTIEGFTFAGKEYEINLGPFTKSSDLTRNYKRDGDFPSY